MCEGSITKRDERNTAWFLVLFTAPILAVLVVLVVLVMSG